MAYLILVRHGESEWNAKGLWTGLTDIGLSEKGKMQSQKAAEALKDIPIDIAFTSNLKRSQETLTIIQNNFHINSIPVYKDKALNERDYGELTGKNKWDIQKEYGGEEFQKLRRGFNYPIKEGETLRDVYNRVVPYYQSNILPNLKNGENVIIVAHGNSLRALIKYLENISDENIQNVEIATGEAYVYTVDNLGTVTSKKILFANS